MSIIIVVYRSVAWSVDSYKLAERTILYYLTDCHVTKHLPSTCSGDMFQAHNLQL